MIAPVPDTNYWATSDGVILRWTGTHLRPVKPRDNGTGYHMIQVYSEGVRSWQLVHRLVWIAFNGAIPSGLEINHKDRRRGNNALENLELLTHRENCMYSINARKAEKANEL